MSVITTTDMSDSDEPSRRRSHPLRRRLAIAAVVAVVLIVLGVILARLYVDWLWFGEVGLRAIFWKRFAIGVVAGPVFAAAFFAVVYGNLEIARRLAPRYRPVEGIDVIEVVHESTSRGVERIGLLVALVGALIAGRSAVGAWLVFARALNGVSFGLRDPVFHHDLSFYLFRLPAWEYAYWFLFASLVVALILSIAAHFAVGGVEVSQREPPRRQTTPEQWARTPSAVRAAEQISRLNAFHVEEGAAIHISALAAALFVLGGLGYLFQAWSLLNSSSGVVSGAGYTDVHLRLPMIRVMMVLAFRAGRRPCLQRRAPAASVVAGGGVRHLAGLPDRAARNRARRLAGAHRQPQPAGQRDAVHRLQHRRDARGLRPHGDLRDPVLAPGRPLGRVAQGPTT